MLLLMARNPRHQKQKKNAGKPRCRSYKRRLGHLIPNKFCLVCGDTRNLSVDHIVPRVSGGARLAPQNVMFLCKKCNSSKGDTDPKTWFQKMVVKNIKNYCPDRHELLRQVVEIAVKFHCQITSLPIAL